MAAPPRESLTVPTLPGPLEVLVRSDHRVRSVWVSRALASWAGAAVVGVADDLLDHVRSVLDG
jgi:hypothetical protein